MTSPLFEEKAKYQIQNNKESLLWAKTGDDAKMPQKEDWTREELRRRYIDVVTAVTIPVNIQVKGQQRILDITETKKILKDAELIAVGQCGCRTRLKKCDSPVDVCIALDKLAEDKIERGFATEAALEQAFEALERSHKAGLVHMAYTYKGNEKPDYVCSCCSCCCHSMSALVRFGMPEALGHIVESNYVALNNLETCINCGTCVERCQFKARRLQKGELVFEEARCFGCGVCVSTCPTKSISLATRNKRV